MADEPSGMELLSGGFGVPSAQASPNAASGEASGMDLLLGRNPPPQTLKSSDLTYDPNRTLGFVDQAKGSFAATDDQWKRIAAQSLYPNDDPAVAAKRFNRTSDGRVYHTGDDGKAYEVQPPSGWGRIANAGEGVGSLVPGIAGLVAGAGAFPLTGGLGSVAAGGIGAYAGDVARQAIGNAIDPGPSQYSQATALKEGALGAAGQAAGVGIGKLATRLNPVDIGHYDKVATEALIDKAQKYGIRLTPAEATNLSSVIGDQKRLAASPSASNTMGRFYDERNQEVMRAWTKFLDDIAPARDATALGRQAGEVAENAVTDAQSARTAAVRPFYETAERQIASVNPGAVVEFIQDAMPTAKGSERAALKFAMSQLQRASADGATDGTIDMSFKGLNGAKMAIDGLLSNPDLAAKQGIDRHAHRTLEQVRNMIVQSIDNAPGAGGAGGAPGPYAAGRSLYAAETRRSVEPVEEVLAPLLRMNPKMSGSLVRVAESVLNPKTRTPDLVREARRQIASRSPETWNGIVRQFMQDHAMTALQENAKGTVSNVGGNISKRIGDDLTEANLRVAMNPAQFREYKDIVDVFRATGRALDANSDTAFKAEAIKKAKDKAGGWTSWALRNVNPVSALKNASDFFAERSFEKQAAAIAKIYAQGDKAAIAQLRSQLRQLGPDDTRNMILIGHLLTQSGAYGVEQAFADGGPVSDPGGMPKPSTLSDVAPDEPPAVAHAIRNFIKQVRRDPAKAEGIIRQWAQGDQPRDRYIASRLEMVRNDLMSGSPVAGE